MEAKVIIPGVYRHYKNKEYLVIGCAEHTETHEQFVVYRALYGERLLWVRPVEMFQEQIDVAGRLIPRFEFIRGEE